MFSEIEIAFKINDKEIYYFPQKQCIMKLFFSEHKFDKTWSEKIDLICRNMEII